MANALCSCGNFADKICLCKYPPEPLCQEHRLPHEQKSSSLTHTYVSAHFIDKIRSQETFNLAIDRELIFNRRKRELQAEIQRMEECINSTETMFGMLQEKINEIKEKTQRELCRKRDDANYIIEMTFRTLSEHLFDENFHSDDALIQQIWSQEAVALRPFHYQIQPIESVLGVITNLVSISWSSLNVSLENPLPYVTSNILRNYCITENLWNAVALTQQTSFSVNSSVTLYDSTRLFICGNNPGSVVNALITSNSGAVQFLPDTLRARNLPGLAVFQRTIYIFAGKDERGIVINICERRVDREWVKLPNSHFKRWGFNPCISGTQIVLLGGEPQSGVETFDTETLTFRRLEVDVPQGFSVSVAEGSDVVVLVKGGVGRWNSDSTRVVVKQVARLPGNCSGSASPLLVGGKIYALQAYAGVVHVVDISSCAYTAISLN